MRLPFGVLDAVAVPSSRTTRPSELRGREGGRVKEVIVVAALGGDGFRGSGRCCRRDDDVLHFMVSVASSGGGPSSPMEPVKDRLDGGLHGSPRCPALTPNGDVAAGRAWNTPIRVPPRGVVRPRTDGLREINRRRDGLARESGNGDACRTLFLARETWSQSLRFGNRPRTPVRVPQLRRVRWPETAGQKQSTSRHRSPHSQASAWLVYRHGAREG